MKHYKSNRSIVYDCKYHIIWCTKYRRKLLNSEIENRLKQIVQSVADERGAGIIEMEANLDHFHMLVEVDPQYGIHRLIKQMKGCSSKY